MESSLIWSDENIFADKANNMYLDWSKAGFPLVDFSHKQTFFGANTSYYAIIANYLAEVVAKKK